MIRVLIIEDSPIISELLQGILETDPGIRVVGRARNGRHGVDMCKDLSPDVVTMDIRMPVMDGFEATETIMAECPTPILVVSSTVNEQDLNTCFQAIQAGAMDVVEKPQGNFSREYVSISRDIVSRVRLIAKVKPIRRPRSVRRAVPAVRPAPQVASMGGRLLAVAASTGGPAALARLLGGLGDRFPWPVLAVQHIAPGFMEGFAQWLGTQVALPVRIGRPGVHPSPGTIYLPSEGCHLGLDAGGRLVLDPSGPVDGHRPSATYLFRTVAATYGPHAIGVILTGMGRDGASGLAEMLQKGAYTIGQDENSSLIYGMPGAAMELGAVKIQLPLGKIASHILGRIHEVGAPGPRRREAAE